MATKGRPPSTKTLVDRQLGRGMPNPVLPAGESFMIPNHSGIADHPEAINQLLDKAKMDGRPLISEDGTGVTLQVGPTREFKTIQEAVDQVPIFLKQRYNIRIDSGTYEEDVIIHPTITYGNTNAHEGEGAVIALSLSSKTLVATDVKIRSLMIITNHGASSPSIDNIQITGVEPTSDEFPAIAVYGGGHAIFANIDFSTTTADTGILFYSASGSVEKLVLGANKLRFGVETKHGGCMIHRSGIISGTCKNYVFFSLGGGLMTFQGNDVTATGAVALTAADNGLIIDTDNKRIYNIEKIGNDDDNYTNFTSSGLQTMVGDARVKKRLQIPIGSFKVPGTGGATETTYGLNGAFSFSKSSNNAVSDAQAVPFDIDISEDPVFTIGWTGGAETTGDAVWQVEVLYRKEDEAWNVTTPDDTIELTVTTSATAHGLNFTSFTLPTLHADDAGMIFKLTRLAEDVDDDLDSVSYLVGAAIDYTANNLGLAV